MERSPLRTRVWLGAGAFLAAAVSASPALTDGRPEPWDRGWNVTNHPADQRMPALSGSRVVWWDERFGRGLSAIFLRDLEGGKELQLTPPGTQNLLPAIAGDKVVYVRLPVNGDWQLFVYDIPTRTERQFWAISTSQGLGRLTMSEDYVVWHERRDGNWDIYLYDIARHGVKRLTHHPAEQADPAVDGHTVVWSDRRHGDAWWDLYRYDLETGVETRVTARSTLGRGAVVSGNRIVWGDIRGYTTGFSVYEYDLLTGKERQVPTSGIENFLSLSGDRLAWVNRNDDNPVFHDDVFAYDFAESQEIRLTYSPSLQWLPAVSGDLVVWEDHRTGDAEIFVHDLRGYSGP